MITKETSLAKIHILDEREPDCARLNLTIQVRLALNLMENGVKVGELQDYPVQMNPDTALVDAFRDASTQLATASFPAVPQDIQTRASALQQRHETPLGLAQWRVTSSQEIVRRLQERAQHENIAAILALAETQLVTARTALSALRPAGQPAIHKETRLSLMTVLSDGTVEVRLRLCVCEGELVVSPAQYHRVVLPPGSDRINVIAAVNNNLTKLDDHFGPMPMLPQQDIDRVEAICGVEHTPARIAAWRAAHP